MKKISVLFAILVMFFSMNNAQVVVQGIDQVTTVSMTSPISGSFSAGTFRATLNGQNEKMYCVDLFHTVQWNTTYVPDGNTSPEVTYILNNYYPYVTNKPGALSDVRREAAAVQGAIWTFVDGMTGFTSPADVEARRLEIVADAIANAGATTPALTLVITPQYQALHEGVDAAFTVEVYDETNAPAENVVVTLSTTDGTLSSTTLTTGANGITDTVYLVQGTLEEATVTASAQVVIPQGTRFVRQDAPNSYQKLVLATPTIDTRFVVANVRWFPEVDLSLVKTVDESEPEDGDVITFTITLSNLTQENAYDIQVTDVLPDGFLFMSSSASVGSYDEMTGLWTLNQLDGNSQATLQITVQVDYATMNNATLNLGPVADFNLFVLNNLTQPSSDTEGKVAVGRNATLSNYSIGDKLTSNGEDVLVVGNKLTYTSGRVYNGNVVYGRFQDIHPTMVSVDEGTIRRDTVIDFPAAKTYLLNLSNTLKGYTVNGTTRFEWGGLTLVGTNPFLNVFNVDGNELSAANNFEINAPNGSVVIVNISRRNVSWTGGASVVGTSKENVIYNFYQANNLTIQGIAVLGTILAPKASVNFVSGVQHGQMICKNLTGQGQFNLANFIGNIPVDPYITNVAEITALANPESNVANNSSSVTVHVNFGANGTNNNQGNWELYSQVGTEMIWSMTYDNSGNSLFGTVGGKLYRNNGTENVLLNEGMNVGFIWDIAVDRINGKIWIATERGVYISRDNGATWELRGLDGVDVRAIVSAGEDHVFAGTWGQGVYELSASTGYLFVAVNDGLTLPIVHALEINANGDLFAGTFGMGIMKLTHGTTTWSQLPVGYNYIWSLAKDSQGKIYAGTYGGGVYFSDDNGSSWIPDNDGLANNYIYSLSVNPSDEVFASTWGAGVYRLETSKSNNWVTIGLAGMNVTSIITDSKDGSIYAATENGNIYKFIEGVTSTEDLSNVEKFELSQNYPNPFNPSTTINFSVAKTGNYKLVVYNSLGEQIAELVNSQLTNGNYNVQFDASKLSSGMYLYRLIGENVNITKKMILIK